MNIAGVILLIIGLTLFISAGVKLDDEPGIEKNHIIVMALGLVGIVAGGILLFGKAFGGW